MLSQSNLSSESDLREGNLALHTPNIDPRLIGANTSRSFMYAGIESSPGMSAILENTGQKNQVKELDYIALTSKESDRHRTDTKESPFVDLNRLDSAKKLGKISGSQYLELKDKTKSNHALSSPKANSYNKNDEYGNTLKHSEEDLNPKFNKEMRFSASQQVVTLVPDKTPIKKHDTDLNAVKKNSAEIKPIDPKKRKKSIWDHLRKNTIVAAPKPDFEMPKGLLATMMINKAKNKFKKLQALVLTPKELELLDDFTVIKTKKKVGNVEVTRAYEVKDLKEDNSFQTRFMKTRFGSFLMRKFPKTFKKKNRFVINDKLSFKDKMKILFRKCKIAMAPNSKPRLLWDSIMMTFLIFTMIILPLQISFGVWDDSDFLEWLNLLIFSADILINFHTGFYQKGDLVLSHKKIAINYIKFWFFIDLLSTFPFEFFNQYLEHNVNSLDSAQFLRLFRVLRLLKVLRGLRFFKMNKIFKNMGNLIQFSQSNHGPLRLIKLLITVILVAHWLACSWHLIAFYESDFDFQRTWLHSQNLIDSDPIVRYIRSIYWAFTTMLTVGYGDILPVTTTETWFVIFAALFGCGVFAFSLNTIGQVVKQISMQRSAMK